jgi:3-mercaptopyruvate sulfurtransferase SseA
LTADTYQTIKPAHELRAMLEAVGATPDKEIVTY